VTQRFLSTSLRNLAVKALVRTLGSNKIRLAAMITDILRGGDHFLSGVHNPSDSSTQLLRAMFEWSNVLNRNFSEVLAGLEPAMRQGILMSLIPAQAFDPNYVGSLDKAILVHLDNLGLSVSNEELIVIRNVCINVNKLKGLNSKQARLQTSGLADLRSNAPLYDQVFNRQNKRCLWCGVDLRSKNVLMTLEHVAPKHLGNDPIDGSNWGIACSSCNTGKAEVLAWPTTLAALDYMDRLGFMRVNEISLAQRWSILMRSRSCHNCLITARNEELWIFRRIRTGLAIPANCSSTCVGCAKKNNLEILLPQWDQKELGRGKPTI
jgi:hypothetical protein